MKNSLRALLISAPLFIVFTVAASAANADPKQDCADAYEATQSFRDRGQLLDARKQAIACTASTCSVYITKDCAQWLTEIDAILPTVVFTARDAAGVDTRNVRVVVDDRTVAEQLDGSAVPLDPGNHIVRFEAPGTEPIEQRFTIKKGEKNRALSASFARALPLTPPALPPPSPTAPTPGPAEPIAPPTGGIGVVTSVVGVVLDVSAANLNSEVVSKCKGDAVHCTDNAFTQAVIVPIADKRDLFRAVGITLGAAGLAGIGVAVVSIVRERSTPSTPQTSFLLVPYASPSTGGLTLQGQF
jgi:hypothetical protein